jgi:ligand-binding sensor domain-containing protein
MAGSAGGARLPFSSDDYVVQVWNVDSGLPQSTVTSIVQTPDGYIWAGTLHGGLARFDGSRFVTFDPGNTPELKSIEIRHLLVDPGGTLWIGTAEGGLVSYRDGKFRFEFENPQTPSSWLNDVISYRKGNILLSSAGGWLFRGIRDGETNRWETFQTPDADGGSNPCEDRDGVIWYRAGGGHLAQVRGTNMTQLDNPPGLRSPQVKTVFGDAFGKIWVVTEKEIAVWNGSGFTDMTPTNGETDLAVRQIAPCKNGSFWVQTDDKLRKCAGRQWLAEADLWDRNFPQSLPDPGLYADSRGGLWAAQYGEGLYHVDGKGHVSLVDNQQGLPSGLVQCWLEDREGNIWVGLRDGGLACVRLRVFHTVWPMENLRNKSAHSVCQDDEGTMWFGTAGQDLLNWRDGVFTSFTPPVQAPWSSDVTVLPDGPGRIWAGSVGNGLWLLENGQFKRPFPGEDIGTVVRCLLKDRAGALWIGSEFGLFRWDKGALKRFTLADGFPAAYVLSIAEDQAGAIWIGTAMGELRRWQAGKFESFHPPDLPGGMTFLRDETRVDPMQSRGRGALSGGERFWALHFDGDGVLWIGTLGGGFLRFENGHFTRFTTRDGLPSKHVSQILEDEHGQFWLGTRAGIVRVAREELNNSARGTNGPVTFVTYGRADGLPTLECSGGNQPDCWKSRDGRLWFSTVKGPVWVDPSALRFNRLPPPVQMEEVLVDGARVTDDAVSPEHPGARVPALVRVAAGRHYIEFTFSALSFTSPDKVRFKWQMKGLDPGWVDGGNRHSVNYNFVPPGDYQFEVQACNNDGVWSETDAPVMLTVLPYFWQTWWFRLAAAVFVASVLLMIYTIRIARLRELEKMRLRIARDLHDDVGANLGTISLLSQIMEEQSPSNADVTKMHSIAVRTINTLRDIIWFIDPANDQLSDLVVRLHETSRMMLQTMDFKFNQTGDFGVADLSLAFRRNVLPIFKETLHNVLKHSQATSVEISVSRRQKEFEFRIRDNGTGFDPGRKSPGNGLKNMKRRAAELGGRLEIESRDGDGTTVTLTAPITQTRYWWY